MQKTEIDIDQILEDAKEILNNRLHCGNLPYNMSIYYDVRDELVKAHCWTGTNEPYCPATIKYEVNIDTLYQGDKDQGDIFESQFSTDWQHEKIDEYFRLKQSGDEEKLQEFKEQHLDEVLAAHWKYSMYDCFEDEIDRIKDEIQAKLEQKD